MTILPLTLALLLPIPAAQAKPARPAAGPELRNAAPETRSQGYRFVVESIHQAQYWQAEFPGGVVEEGPAPAGRVNGRQLVYVRLAVYPPRAGLVPNIEGLDPKIVALAAGEAPVTFRSNPPDDANPLLSGVWRTQLLAQEVELGVTSLRRMNGELLVYPRARVVQLDFPIQGRVPQVRDEEGFRATLRSAKYAKGTLTAMVDTEWPRGASIARPNPDSPSGIIALTRSGTPLVPNGGSSSGSERGSHSVRQYTLTFSGLAQPPATIRVEVLVRGGAVRRIPFRLPDLALPGAAELRGLLQEPDAAAEPLDQGHPLYATDGGTLDLGLRPPPPAAGRLLVGLSLQENGAFGPWRWIEATLPARGPAVIASLRPGKYRVSRLWMPGPAEPDLPQRGPALPVRLGGMVEVDVSGGSRAVLPGVAP